MSTVVGFPPLPKPPAPPQLGVDPRQRRTSTILSNLGGMLAGGGAGVATANMSSGFFAASVNVGALQATLEAGLSRFTLPIVRDRWDEVRPWIEGVLYAWTQRLKESRVELKENGVRIAIKTQDDLGYYDYAFDVFPGRAREEGS
ncbi:MAG: hypothetical protein SFW67_34525 [Myxococcaceae bacterium]|nr:hypothetical protein [Myxococcaceae bacterium]